MENFDVLPSDTPAHTQAEGFGKGLFGSKAKGKGRGGKDPLIAELRLLFREHPAYKTLAPAFEHRLHPGNVNEINANTVNHKNQNTGDRIQNTEEKSHRKKNVQGEEMQCRLLKNTCRPGCSKTFRCKAPETGDPPEGWGVRAFCGQIPKSEAYIEVRRNDEE
jgi:hypothetical protein